MNKGAVLVPLIYQGEIVTKDFVATLKGFSCNPSFTKGSLNLITNGFHANGPSSFDLMFSQP